MDHVVMRWLLPIIIAAFIAAPEVQASDQNCTAPQVEQWEVITAAEPGQYQNCSAGHIGAACTIGQTFSSQGAAESACGFSGTCTYQCAGVTCSWTGTTNFVSNTHVSSSTHRHQLVHQLVPGGGNPATSPAELNSSQIRGTCTDPPPEPTCEVAAGTTKSMSVSGVSSPPSGPVCNVNCNWTDTGLVGMRFPGEDTYWNTFTTDGTTCTVNDGNADANPTQTATAEDGSTVNLSFENEDCFEFHGENLCVFGGEPGGVGTQQLPNSGACDTTVGGQSACSDHFTSPDAPDTGTEGDPANPDLVVVTSGGSNSTINIYNQTTTGNSTHTPGTAPGGDPTGGSDPENQHGCDPATDPSCIQHCDPSTDPECGTGCDPTKGEECGFTGGTNCLTAPTCDGAPITCAVARYTWRMNCLFQMPTDTQVNNAIDDGLGEDDLIPKEEYDISDHVDVATYQPAACLDDIQITTPWNVLIFQLSLWCPFFQTSGYIVLLATGFWTLRVLRDL